MAGRREHDLGDWKKAVPSPTRGGVGALRQCFGISRVDTVAIHNDRMDESSNGGGLTAMHKTARSLVPFADLLQRCACRAQAYR